MSIKTLNCLELNVLTPESTIPHNIPTSSHNRHSTPCLRNRRSLTTSSMKPTAISSVPGVMSNGVTAASVLLLRMSLSKKRR
jgi:hypothetical protein